MNRSVFEGGGGDSVKWADSLDSVKGESQKEITKEDTKVEEISFTSDLSRPVSASV